MICHPSIVEFWCSLTSPRCHKRLPILRPIYCATVEPVITVTSALNSNNIPGIYSLFDFVLWSLSIQPLFNSKSLFILKSQDSLTAAANLINSSVQKKKKRNATIPVSFGKVCYSELPIGVTVHVSSTMRPFISKWWARKPRLLQLVM